MSPSINSMIDVKRDLTRTVLAVLTLGLLIGFSFWILRPFLAPLLWAVTIVVATWPVMRGVQARLWGRRSLAVMVMTLALLLVFVVPFTLAINTIVENSETIVGWARSITLFKVPPAPDWLVKLPLIGKRLAAAWAAGSGLGLDAFAEKAAPYARGFATWFVAEVGGFGMVFLQFLLTVAIAAILYSSGENAATMVQRFARRLAGDRGDGVIRLAAMAIRGVALGVVVTALIQSVLGGIGLAIAGIPFATLLTAVMFMLAIAQLGPLLVLAPAVGWLYWQGDSGPATVLLVWTIVVGSLDNFLRPFLIKKGADLPLLLIFAGVIGGLIAFGLVGIFVGPVVLAITYTLLEAWIADETPQSGDTGAGPASDLRSPP